MLLWSSVDGQDPNLALIRSRHEGSTEAFVRKGKTLWTKRDQEAWSERPVDDDFHLRWVWEHRRCVWDLLALAGSSLQLTAKPPPKPGQLQFAVGLKDGQPATMAAPQTANPRSAWRAHARVLSLSGTLTLDQSSGTWVHAQLETRFAIDPPETKPFEGSASLTASAGPVDATKLTWPEIHSPNPLPKPPRYQHEQEQLLQGLAPGGAAGLGSLR